ncbi:UNVERIFIED_CONTAM: ferredoxin [Streptomyces graminofaciens]
MTVTTSAPSGGSEAPVPPEDLVTLTIDGIEISVPKGTLVIRAAELLGIEIPRFCDHPLLDPAGACRQCIVEVEGQRKPMASCTITCTDGMVVRSQLTSPVAEKAQKGVMELLLINHPLDCPVCDKGGECPLQNQAVSHGQAESRFDGKKRTFEKPVPLSTQVLLDRERCVLCARCTRFSNQVAGDPMIELLERGALQQVGTGEGDPFESYFSGNTIQICPVGALTSAAYRFRSRPFDLVSSPSVCEHCAGGCATRTDHRRGKVMRRLAAQDPEVNEEWLCDKGRFGFRYAQQRDRLTTPLVRNEQGVLEPASWPEALEAAARGLVKGRTGVLTGGRLTVEDAYAYAKFARVALDTNDIDFRARAHSAEEADFLAARVAGQGPGPLRHRGHLHVAGEGPGGAARGLRGGGGGPRRLPAATEGQPQARTACLLPRHARHARTREGGRHPAARGARHRDRVAERPRLGRRPRRGRREGVGGAARRGRGDRGRRAARRRARRSQRRRPCLCCDRRTAGVDPAPRRRAGRRGGGRAAVAAARRPPGDRPPGPHGDRGGLAGT